MPPSGPSGPKYPDRRVRPWHDIPLRGALPPFGVAVVFAHALLLTNCMCRSSTPTMAGPIYFALAIDGDCGAELGPHLLNVLRECGGGVVSSSVQLEKTARAEVGSEAGAASALRLKAIDAAELVVADVSGADATIGGEVMYALHRRRVPTLCLWRRGTGGAFAASLAGGFSHPLLTAVEYEDAAGAEAAVVAFATPPEEPGRIFVIDGGDGAGKQTQSRLLLERLAAEGYPVSTLDYPHDSALHGKLIRTLLSGAKGDIKQVRSPRPRAPMARS